MAANNQLTRGLMIKTTNGNAGPPTSSSARRPTCFRKLHRFIWRLEFAFRAPRSLCQTDKSVIQKIIGFCEAGPKLDVTWLPATDAICAAQMADEIGDHRWLRPSQLRRHRHGCRSRHHRPLLSPFLHLSTSRTARCATPSANRLFISRRDDPATVVLKTFGELSVDPTMLF